VLGCSFSEDEIVLLEKRKPILLVPIKGEQEEEKGKVK